MVDSKALRAFEPRVGYKPPDVDLVVDDEIIEIIPATGWHAQFSALVSGRRDQWTEPVACWALIRRRGGRTAIVGMVRQYDNPELICASDPTFTSYEADYDRGDE